MQKWEYANVSFVMHETASERLREQIWDVKSESSLYLRKKSWQLKYWLNVWSKITVVATFDLDVQYIGIISETGLWAQKTSDWRIGH